MQRVPHAFTLTEAAQPLSAWQGLKTTDDGAPGLAFHVSWMTRVGSEEASDN